MKKNHTLTQIKSTYYTIFYCLVFTLLGNVIAPIALAANTTKEKPVRWFEMEVILFSQLGDKTQLNESFVNDTALPRYRGVRELLTDYLQPDITPLRKHLPWCPTLSFHKQGTSIVPNISIASMNNALSKSFNQQLAASEITPPLFQLKSIKTLHNEMLQNSIDINSNTNINSRSTSYEELNTQKNGQSTIESTTLNQRLNNSNNAAILFDTSIDTLTPIFNDLTYHYTPIKFNNVLCRLSPQSITALKQFDPTFDENAILTDSVPRTIDGIEQLNSDQPYLISASSLQLHDIVKKIRSSREFKPMLHIGWRQSEPAINTKKSIPMHLFAGENLQANYQNQLIQFEAEQKAAQEQESVLQNILTGSDTQNSAAQSINALTTKNQLDHIITSLSNIPNNNIDLIAQLDKLKQDNQISLDEESVNTGPLAPIAPPQHWSIDGLFNVHVDHYLYITADFNIANMTLAEQASERLKKGEPQPIKSIRFSQNKRVISKEIHYFDHPYMGMIVQIRRYKRPTPEEIKTIKVAQSSSLLTN